MWTLPIFFGFGFFWYVKNLFKKKKDVISYSDLNNEYDIFNVKKIRKRRHRKSKKHINNQINNLCKTSNSESENEIKEKENYKNTSWNHDYYTMKMNNFIDFTNSARQNLEIQENRDKIKLEEKLKEEELKNEQKDNYLNEDNLDQNTNENTTDVIPIENNENNENNSDNSSENSYNVNNDSDNSSDKSSNLSSEYQKVNYEDLNGM